MFSWLEQTYSAFWALSRQRSSGFVGPEKLKVVDILQFFDAFEPHESREEFYGLIAAMDECYITLAQEERAKQTQGGVT